MSLPKFYNGQQLKHEKDGKITYFKIEAITIEDGEVKFHSIHGVPYLQDECSPLTEADYDLSDHSQGE